MNAHGYAPRGDERLRAIVFTYAEASAFMVLRRALRREMRRMPELAESRPGFEAALMGGMGKIAAALHGIPVGDGGIPFGD